MINNSELIEEGDRREIINDCERLLKWFLKENNVLGHLPRTGLESTQCRELMEKEFEIGFCSCPKCGKETPEDIKFCMDCGVKQFDE